MPPMSLAEVAADLQQVSRSASYSGCSRPKRSTAGARSEVRFGEEVDARPPTLQKRLGAGEFLLTPPETPSNPRSGKKARLTAPTLASAPLSRRALAGTAPMPARQLAVIKSELLVWSTGLGDLLPNIKEELVQVYVDPPMRRAKQLWPDPKYPGATLQGAAASGLTQRGVMMNGPTIRIWHAAGFGDHARLASAMSFLQPHNLEELLDDSHDGRWCNLYAEAKPICDVLAAAGVHVPNWCRDEATGSGVVVKYHHFFPSEAIAAESAFHTDTQHDECPATNWRMGPSFSSGGDGKSTGVLQFRHSSGRRTGLDSYACVGTSIKHGESWAMGPTVRGTGFMHNRFIGPNPDHGGMLQPRLRTPAVTFSAPALICACLTQACSCSRPMATVARRPWPRLQSNSR